MNALMFDTHHDGPPGAIPANRQSQRRFADKPVDHATYGFPVGTYFFNSRPAVMGSVQIIPAHLIHPDREHGFHSGVDSFRNQSRKQQLVSKKS